MKGRAVRSVLLSGMLGALAACAGTGATGPDPWAAANRPVFGFNQGLDRCLVEPLAKGWSRITPEAFRVSLDRFFRNAGFPARFVSNLGQGEPAHAGSELLRFLTNTTLGVLGLFDPASRLGLGAYDEDLGQMFGHWGIPAGPYWVIPVLGPSSPRDAVGGILDSLLTLTPPGRTWPLYLVLPRVVNQRAIASRKIDLARRAALDYYVFVREAYLRSRLAQVRSLSRAGAVAGPPDESGPAEEDLYRVPDDLEDEEESSGVPRKATSS